MAEVGGPPLLVADEQQRELGVALRALGEGAQRAEREDVAALHVTLPEPTNCRPALQRLVLRVGDDGVLVADSSALPRAGAMQAGDEILGVARLEQGTRRSSPRRARAPRTRAHSSAPWTSPDGDETATSASSSRGARARDLRRRLLDPRIHAAG